LLYDGKTIKTIERPDCISFYNPHERRRRSARALSFSTRLSWFRDDRLQNRTHTAQRHLSRNFFPKRDVSYLPDINPAKTNESTDRSSVLRFNNCSKELECYKTILNKTKAKSLGIWLNKVEILITIRKDYLINT